MVARQSIETFVDVVVGLARLKAVSGQVEMSQL